MSQPASQSLSALTRVLAEPDTVAGYDDRISAEALFKRGMEEYNKFRYKEALTHFKEMVDLYPHLSEAWLNLGNAHFHLNEQIQAEQAWRKALDLNPLEHNAYLNLGNLYYKQQLYPKAVRCWEQFKLLKPGHKSVWLNLGIAYEQLYDIDKAVESYMEYICLDLGSSSARQLQIRFEDARKVFEGNLKIGEKALKAGNLQRAREAFEKAIPLYPGTAKVYRVYATLLYRMGETGKALRYFELSYQRSPETSAGSLVNMGVIYEKDGNFADAIWAYHCALETHGCPDIEKVRERLDKLLSEQRQLLEGALETAEQCYQDGDFDAAEKGFERLERVSAFLPQQRESIRKGIEALKIQKDPRLKASQIFFQLAEHAGEQGKYNQAMAYYQQFLELEPSGERAEKARQEIVQMQQRIGAVIKGLIEGPKDIK